MTTVPPVTVCGWCSNLLSVHPLTFQNVPGKPDVVCKGEVHQRIYKICSTCGGTKVVWDDQMNSYDCPTCSHNFHRAAPTAANKL
jgi:hypothetical protein